MPEGAGLVIGLVVDVGHHVTGHLLGMTFDLDTIWSTAVAAILVLGVGFLIRTRIASGVPGRLQLAYETVVGAIRKQVDTAIGPAGSKFVPLAAGLFLLILVSNWLEVIPSGQHPELLPAPTGDVNMAYALAVVTVVAVQAAAIQRHGLLGTFRHYAAPYGKWLAPLAGIEELVKPVTLSLRLFGNMFAGGLMITLLALLPPEILWLPTAAWKLFDMFIGLIQAFIFSLLALIYAEQAIAGH
jgi:F-type H+-transporting ATPase subunit a